MKKLNLTFLVIGLLVMLVCAASVFAQKKGVGVVPKDGFVPDQETAVKIAEAVLVPIYGRKHVESEQPFKARLWTNSWVVRGTLRQPTNDPSSVLGGVAEVHIDKSSGCITYVTHTR